MKERRAIQVMLAGLAGRGIRAGLAVYAMKNEEDGANGSPGYMRILASRAIHKMKNEGVVA